MEPWLNTIAWAEAYLHVKFHFDACNRLARIHQRDTDRTGQTDGQTGQRTDSIGRTVLQMVAQKPYLGERLHGV